MNVVLAPPAPPPPAQPRHWTVRALLGLLGVVALMALSESITGIYQFWDVGSDSWFARLRGRGDDARAAALTPGDQYDGEVKQIKYLDQNWAPADSLWFYNTTQGSDLLPYDFFLALEQKGSREPFRSDAHMNHYRYLPQKPSLFNEDALPVGFVKDTYQNKEYVGLTCAACHTGQLNVGTVGYRIDGGPSGANMKLFVEDLAAALVATSQDGAALARFVGAVRARHHYRTDKEVTDDLGRYAQRLTMYTIVNHSDTDYGPYRLDAFGRIYNRVLEHLVDRRVFVGVLQRMVAAGELTSAELDALCQCKDERLPEVLSDDDRDHLVARINLLAPEKQQALRDRLFNAADAPVSYPFIWDVPQHDYVQWNGLAANAAFGPVGRNTGEAIGVFGTLDWSSKVGISLPSIISGQGLRGRHISFKSSVNVVNLARIERHLTTLQSPEWPAAFGLDTRRVAAGRRLFATYCASCHAEIDRADPARRVVAHLSRIRDIGTDPKMAENGVNYSGFSGIIRNQYVNAGPGNILIDEQAPVAALLTKATLSVIAEPDPDKNAVARFFYWVYDLAGALLTNKIQPSLKNGNYDPDTTADPYASLRSYKARSLNGIWATAPYLHNGSVPTLYHLLLPKRRDTDPAVGEYRPDTFIVGSREFLTDKVGLKYEGYNGFEFNTALPGNSNTGHEYGAREMTAPNGDILPPLTAAQRWELIEYLKVTGRTENQP